MTQHRYDLSNHELRRKALESFLLPKVSEEILPESLIKALGLH